MNLTTTTQVYIAPEPMKYADKPTATFTAEGSIASPSLLDVNNDGLRDMVVIKVPFGLKNIMNYFMRRKVTVTAQGEAAANDLKHRIEDMGFTVDASTFTQNGGQVSGDLTVTS